MSNLIFRTEMVNIATARGAATSTVNSAVVDMQGHESVCFLGRFATVHATTEGAQVVQASATGAAFTAITGAVARAVTNYRIDVHKPVKRFLKVKTSRQSGALGDQWAIQYGSRVRSSSTQSFVFQQATA